jgi:predicted nucleic acid-binding Zn ribbon protein
VTWRPLPDPDGPAPRPVADSLDAVARNLGGAGGPALVSQLTRWPDVVGAQLAAHCRPLSLRGGTLTIGADSPAWASQIAWLEADLRRRFDEALGTGAVARVAVRVLPP